LMSVIQKKTEEPASPWGGTAEEEISTGSYAMKTGSKSPEKKQSKNRSRSGKGIEKERRELIAS